MGRVLLRSAVMGFLMIHQALPSQNNRKGLLWLSLLNEFEGKRTGAFVEIENSRLLMAPRQDYFTVLTHAEFRKRHTAAGGGVSWWLLYDPRGRAIPEWRPHLQVSWAGSHDRYSFVQRNRIENRFIRDTIGGDLATTYNYTLRPRFRYEASYVLAGKLNRKGVLQVTFSNELILEFNKRISWFSENRLYGGIWYALTGMSTIQIGYVWIFSRHDLLNNSDILYLTWRNNFGRD